MSIRIATPVLIASLELGKDHAKSVGLRYVCDSAPGIARRRCGGGFIYVAADGKRVRDEPTLLRIRKLAIPPAYQRVWICALADGHLQATGFDAFGRKQYRYHTQWQAVRAQNKFSHMLEFAAALPRLRAQVDRDLRRNNLDRLHVLATALRVLDSTLIRVGNDRYTAKHGSYGLTTLQDRHVDIRGGHLEFHFLGKSKQNRELHVDDPLLAKLVRRCRDLPGQRLFVYKTPAGEIESIDSADINDHLHKLTGHPLTAKDFRTWGGTVHAAVTLARMGPAATATATERNIVAAIKEVARRLGNLPATSRKYYIHPAVLDAYRDGSLMKYMKPSADPKRMPPRAGLMPEESAGLALLTDANKALRKAAKAKPAASKPAASKPAAAARKPLRRAA